MMRRMSSETRYGTLCGGRLPILIRMPDTGIPTNTTTHTVVTNFQPSWISVLHSIRRKTEGARCCLRAECCYAASGYRAYTSSAIQKRGEAARVVGPNQEAARVVGPGPYATFKVRSGAWMQARLP